MVLSARFLPLCDRLNLIVKIPETSTSIVKITASTPAIRQIFSGVNWAKIPANHGLSTNSTNHPITPKSNDAQRQTRPFRLNGISE